MSRCVRQLLLISSSRLEGYEPLEFAANDINALLKKNNVSTLLFIPYALKDHDTYLANTTKIFSKWGYEVVGIHNSRNPIEAVQKAQAIFVGGGNTFRLLKTLYDNQLIDEIQRRVLEEGVPYIGASAGTNVATRSIHTTNDMPIVFPKSFEGLALVPFNINPHYLDADRNSTHKGETREERIIQYLEEAHAGPVLGLREGSWLQVEGCKATLKGLYAARLFVPKKDAKEYESGKDMSFLLDDDWICRCKQ
ncbi:protease s51 alpha-aspartyl dipeptidase [Holotrichia oblita]|uniref:Protease s51 alpha-aspartyl dipeptidase n=1 Tax=Holotrichia oblita TaxID=644536 RepID=A0ACB9THB9_HOLOL|nr:protease s51 alpha-aspartyl dipeptidase [Holotrichia oblita]